MKTVSDELFVFIKSLTKQEKRYFNLFASKHVIGKKNKYLMLFEAIDKQDEYDEQKLKDKFRKETFIKQFFVIKNYLYELILKSLSSYYVESSEESRIHHLLNCADILFEKGLYGQCEKILAKAEKITTASENFALLLEVLGRKTKVIKAVSFHEISEKYLDVLYEKKKNIAEKIHNGYQYELANTKFLLKTTKMGWFVRSPDELEREYYPLINNKIFRDQKEALSFRAQIYYSITNSIYYYLKGDAKKSYEYSRQMVDRFDRAPGMIEGHLEYYISTLGNLIFTSMLLKNYWEALEYINRLKATKSGSIFLRAKIISSAYLPEIIIYNSSQQVEKAIKLILMIEDGIERVKKYLSKSDLFYFRYNFACVYFKADQFQKASQYLFAINNDPDIQSLPDIQANARILNLMVQYELENSDQLPYLLRSTYRFLSKQKRLYKFETKILQFIRKLPDISHKGISLYFLRLKNELMELSVDPYEKKAMEYFGIIRWLDGKIPK